MRCTPGKERLSLRVSITDRCQLRCRYCMPAEGVESCGHDSILSYEAIVRFVRFLQAEFGLDKVRITGGDPLARKGVEHLVGMLADLGVADLALTTNGQRLEHKVAALKRAGLQRLNISLDSLVPGTFRALTRRGDLAATLAGIDAARQAGLAPIKLNMVVMKGINDDELVPMVRFAAAHDCELRFLELMPLGTARVFFDEHYMSGQAVRDRLVRTFDIEPLPDSPGSTSRRYHMRGAAGSVCSVGFISANSEPFCHGCRRLRLTADGYVIGCLSRGNALAVKHLIGEGSDHKLRAVVREALSFKGSRPIFEAPRRMAAVGG